MGNSTTVGENTYDVMRRTTVAELADEHVVVAGRTHRRGHERTRATRLLHHAGPVAILAIHVGGKRHTSSRWRSFLEARAFVRSKGLTNQAEWRTFCRSGDKPDDIPAAPQKVYKAEWRGMGDWLGTGAVAPRDRQYRSFQAARAFVRSKGLTNQAEWRAFCRSGDKPDDIPAAPQKVYKAEWRGMGDWLGTGAVAPRDRQYRSFQAARAFVRSKGLTNQAEWRTFCGSGGKPDDIPAHPERTYKVEWRGTGDWLGTGAVASR